MKRDVVKNKIQGVLDNLLYHYMFLIKPALGQKSVIERVYDRSRTQLALDLIYSFSSFNFDLNQQKKL